MSEHTKIKMSVPSLPDQVKLVEEIERNQVEFIEMFTRNGSPANHLLIAQPGTGKMHTACTIVARMQRTGHANHILVFTPAALRAQWSAKLSTDASLLANLSAKLAAVEAVLGSFMAVFPVTEVDRQVFRELQAAVPVGQTPWGPPGVVVVSRDLAKFSDVASSLLAQTWDLVIVDESHSLSGASGEFLRQMLLSGRVRRLLLMTATPNNETSLVPDVVITKWRPTLMSYRLSELLYTPDADEQRFIESLNSFLDSQLLGNFVATISEFVRYQAESSIFSLEPVLIRWMEELTGSSNELRADADRESEETKEEADKLFLNWRDKANASNGIRQLLSMLDAVQSDAKLQILLTEVTEMRRSNSEQTGICIVTRYARTALYLHSALIDAGMHAGRVTGDMPDEERINAIETFRSRGGAIVITHGALQGVEMPEARTVIVYDTLAPAAFEQVIGSFNRYGRWGPLTILVMKRHSA